MARRVVDYTTVFTPTSNRLDLSAIPSFNITHLLAVVDVTARKIIYAMGEEGFGFTSVVGGVVTLERSTNLPPFSATDKLAVYYDDGYLASTAAATTMQLAIGGALVSESNRVPVEIDAQNAGLGLDASLQSLIALSSEIYADVGVIGTGAPTLPGGSSGLLGLLRYIASLYPPNSGAPWLAAPIITNPSAAFARPANTTPYANGNLVANSTSAGSVAPMAFTVSRATGGSGRIYRARLVKSTANLTNATFCLRVFGTSPTVTAGDGGAYAPNQAATFLGKFYITMGEAFSDGAMGIGTPEIGQHIDFVVGGSQQTAFGLLTATSSYVPGSAEVFTATLEVGEGN